MHRQEQTEGRERNLMEDRTVMFPDHWWEPRVTTSEGLIKVKMNMGNEVKVNKKEWGSKYPYALFEPLLWFWRTAEWDYSLETVVEEGKERDPGAEWTTWIVAAADFYYLTGIPLCKTDEIMEDRTLDNMAFFFRTATRTMWKVVEAEEPETKKDKNVMGTLGLAKAAVIRGLSLIHI